MQADKNITYLALVVVYDTDFKESETINSLADLSTYLGDSKVVIWDNSTDVQKPSNIQWAYDCFKHVEYIHKPENLPLSVVYNTVIKTHCNDGYDYLILLDQDSKLPTDFFIKLNEAVKAFNDVSLFLPIVISSNQIVSPADIFFFKGKYWKTKKLGLQKAKNKTAINSGMVISFKYLKNRFVGYDERLLFYGTDTYFMKMYAKDNESFCVFNSEVSHHLAYSDFNNIDGIVKRHPEIVKSILFLNSDNPVIKVLTLFYLFLFTIKQSFKYRDIRFLKW